MHVSVVRQLCYISLFVVVYATQSEQRDEVKDFLRIHRLQRGRRHIDTPVFRHCPNGYTRYDKSCYIVTEAVVSWPVALVYCEAFGGHLAYIESQREQKFINAFLKTVNPRVTRQYYWIGGTDAVTEGEWFWAPAVKPVTYTNWGPGNPNLYTQDCVALYGNGRWDDGYCRAECNFICEIELDV
ncbi:galactose-specific lectin nattectin-like [Mercenaria mercenaria]|uniref:galactose-specific lectin nattectin-like n=1 Tax=Mercenaria mercenaria TaxID=6596 RepID=UPI00234F11ED|nr:galactose-specific lectin nattectin-like [Mercenaria mercenaria]